MVVQKLLFEQTDRPDWNYYISSYTDGIDLFIKNLQLFFNDASIQCILKLHTK